MARRPHFPATPKTPALVSAVRDWSGWLVVAAGAVLCVLGWYGISGENVIEQQLPYLASATIPGAALIVAGAMLVIFRPARRTEQADRRIETLYTLLVTDAVAADAAAPARPREEADGSADGADTLLAVPGGTLYHRRDCPLIAGKPMADAIDAEAAAERALAPCPVCEPPVFPLAGSGDTGSGGRGPGGSDSGGPGPGSSDLGSSDSGSPGPGGSDSGSPDSGGPSPGSSGPNGSDPGSSDPGQAGP